MKIYNIKVNGKEYIVEVQSIQESKKVEVIEQSPVEIPALPISGHIVKSPMQGQIIKVLVKVGSVVKKGTILCVLEAMKLENEIVSPIDGVIKSLKVSANTVVENNQELFVIG